jgi:anaerobic selenocysteine-containing dehydrogenase
LLLPAKTRYEQEGGGTETTTERRVCFSPEIPRQVGEARAEWLILRQLAALAKPDGASQLGCETAQAIREEIARVIPSYDGIQNLMKTGDAFQYGGRHLCADANFPTPDGKAHVKAVPLPEGKRQPGEFHCSTRRGKQFNTLIYAEVDPITGAARDAVFINPDDAAELHLTGGDPIVIHNDVGRMNGRAFLAPIARGSVQVHWPEGNVVIRRGVIEPVGGIPDYSAIVRIEPLPRIP